MTTAVTLLSPQLLAGSGTHATWIDMRGVQTALVIVNVDADGTGATFSLHQATDAAGTGRRPLRQEMFYDLGVRVRTDFITGTFPGAATFIDLVDVRAMRSGPFLGLSWRLPTPAICSAVVLQKRVYA